MSPCDCCSIVVLGITANPPHKDQAWRVDAITETQPQQAVKCNCCAYFSFMCLCAVRYRVYVLIMTCRLQIWTCRCRRAASSVKKEQNFARHPVKYNTTLSLFQQRWWNETHQIHPHKYICILTVLCLCYSPTNKYVGLRVCRLIGGGMKTFIISS